MVNRYYVVDLTSAKASRIAAVRDRLLDGGIRVRPEQRLHWRRAKGERAWLIQAEVSADEHTFLTTGARANWVTYIGDYDPVAHRASQSVFDYLAANADIWANTRPDNG